MLFEPACNVLTYSCYHSLCTCAVLFEVAPRDSEGVDEFHSGCHGEDVAVGGISAGRGGRPAQTGTVL